MLSPKPSAHAVVVQVHANTPTDCDPAVDDEDPLLSTVKNDIRKIGGWWNEQATRIVFRDGSVNPSSAEIRERLAALRDMIMADAAVYGVVAALMIGVATSSLSVNLYEGTDIVTYIHTTCWSFAFYANLLCLLASTIEYVNVISVVPEDLLQRLAKIYPKTIWGGGSCRNVNPLPPLFSGEEKMHDWSVRWSVDKFTAFRIGFWMTIPGVVTTAWGVYGRRFAIVPGFGMVCTIIAGKIIWRKEHGSFWGQ